MTLQAILKKVWPVITDYCKEGNMYHVVDVLPVVQGDELEGGEHGPQQVVEACEAVVRIFPNAVKAHKTVRTGPE